MQSPDNGARNFVRMEIGRTLVKVLETAALRLVQTTAILLLPGTNTVHCSKIEKFPINHNSLH